LAVEGGDARERDVVERQAEEVTLTQVELRIEAARVATIDADASMPNASTPRPAR
jgi:hypothetical protein